jgi:hypothetical protein
MKKSQIKNILVLLENEVDKSTAKILRENANSDAALLAMAKKHFAYEKRINDLYDQLSAEEQGMQENDLAIFNALQKIKGKSVKFGKILMKIQRTRTIIKGKNTYSWKGVVDGVKEVFQDEERIMKVFAQHESANFHPAQDKINVNNDLVIRKESIEAKALITFIEESTGKKVVLKENLFHKIKHAIVSVFRKYFKSYSNSVDNLAVLVQSFDEMESESRQPGSSGLFNSN